MQAEPNRSARDTTITTSSLSPLYNKAIGGQVPAVASDMLLPDSYAPYYVGFAPRLVAGLLDLFFMGAFQLITLFLVIKVKDSAHVTDLMSWLGTYGPLVLLGLLIFAAYHIIQWTLWGTTLGKHIMNMKVVGADGQRLGLQSRCGCQVDLSVRALSCFAYLE
jgi:hypothetical protein